MTIRFLSFCITILLFLNATLQNRFTVEFNLFAEKPEYRNAQIGLQVIDAVTDEVLFESNSEKMMIPASVLKIVTSATALEILGADYQFKTKIGYTGSIQNGVLEGDLVVISGGDPTLGSDYFQDKDFLKEWIDNIQKAGIKVITGNLVLDGSNYETEDIPPTWVWGDLGNYYGACFNPFSVYDNLFTITFKSGKTGEKAEIISIKPKLDGLEIDNRVVSSDKNFDNAYVFGSPFDKNRLIRGTIPKEKDSFSIKASLPDPSELLAAEFTNSLSEAGILLKGKQITITDKTEGFTEIFVYRSPELQNIVQILNHESVNLFAEHLLLQLGFEKKGIGSRENGIAVIQDFWKEKGLETQNLMMEDGSGLSHFNALTPSFLDKVLLYMIQSPNYTPFYNSLPAAGEGTLSSFDSNNFQSNSLKAKSGSMTRVRSYSGYLNSNSGKNLVFTIMINHFGGTQAKLRNEIENLLVEAKNIF